MHKKTGPSGPFFMLSGGEGGIRTRGGDKPTHAFQACDLNRSSTSPKPAIMPWRAVCIRRLAELREHFAPLRVPVCTSRTRSFLEIGSQAGAACRHPVNSCRAARLTCLLDGQTNIYPEFSPPRYGCAPRFWLYRALRLHAGLRRPNSVSFQLPCKPSRC